MRESRHRFQSSVYSVRPTRCRWLADPRQITEPAGNFWFSKSSMTKSVSSPRPPPSILATLTQLLPAAMLETKFWSETQMQAALPPTKMECSLGQVMQDRVVGSNKRLMFWLLTSLPFRTREPTKHISSNPFSFSKLPTLLTSPPTICPSAVLLAISTALSMKFASLPARH